MSLLETYGWHESHRGTEDPADIEPARVLADGRDMVALMTDSGACLGQISPRLHNLATGPLDLPGVGDFVGIRRVDNLILIDHIFVRTSQLCRKAAGRRTGVQLMACNLDTVFVVTAMNQEFNPRRLERYLAAILGGGAEPVIVLNKSDLAPDPSAFEAQTHRIAGEVEVVAMSALDDPDVASLRQRMGPGRTCALVGSSGVGKSTILNRLLGEQRQDVLPIRDDHTGRHTTTRRELFELDGAGLIIDTPGLREFGLWDDADIGAAFPEIEEVLGRGCRFRDCTHGAEPGCCVLAALESGELDPARWKSYAKLGRELERLDRQTTERANWGERRAQKRFSKMARRVQAEKRRLR